MVLRPVVGGLFAAMATYTQVHLGLTHGDAFSEPAYFYIANGNRLFAYLLILFLTAGACGSAHRLRYRHHQ